MSLGLPALMGGVVLMYLYDSALLLYHDQVAFETRCGGKLVAGGFLLEVAGRQLFLPNPLAPFRPLYRLSWRTQASPRGRCTNRTDPRRLAARYSILVPWIIALLVLFGVGLPACLWLGGGAIALLAWLVATYLTIAATLVMTCLHRRRLGLSGLQVWAIARDALLCPPFALNLLRRISLEQSHRLDLRAILSGAATADATVALARLVQARIATSLTYIGAGCPEERELLDAQSFYGRFGHDAL